MNPIVDRLLKSDEPCVRFWIRTGVLGENQGSGSGRRSPGARAGGVWRGDLVAPCHRRDDLGMGLWHRRARALCRLVRSGDLAAAPVDRRTWVRLASWGRGFTQMDTDVAKESASNSQFGDFGQGFLSSSQKTCAKRLRNLRTSMRLSTFFSRTGHIENCWESACEAAASCVPCCRRGT